MAQAPSVGGLTIVLSVLVCLVVYRLFAKRIPKGLRLPPGPPRKPIVGNMRDMPAHHEWETFMEWSKRYGGLVYTQVFGQPIVLVNSADVAHDLFEKRSSLYSDRFPFTMANELMGFDWNLGLMPYGERWRRHRRIFHQNFNPKAAATYHDIQLKQARFFLRRLYEWPGDFTHHLQHYAGGIIMEVTYGLKVLPRDDPYVEIVDTASAALAEAGTPGTFLVDTLPFLKYIPEWMPGAGFRRKAREWREPIMEVVESPFMAVKMAVSMGTAGPSILASLLQKLATRTDAPPDEEETIRNTTGVAYFSGVDTTKVPLMVFILNMATHPEIQRKAQQEVDSVVGNSRLPVFGDRENLPYVNALCKELLRWRAVVPLGVAHALTRDDVYGDYFIPGGSIVIGNSWAMLRDESTYGPEPENFNPERFLKDGAKYPIEAFGFGRRICPGRHLADNSIFIAVVSMLAVFNITPAKDADGNEVPVEPVWKPGFIPQLEPFLCSIKPRSAASKKLLLQCTLD